MTNRPMTVANSTSLADLLERVLDKGVVIAGDITIMVANVELLTIKIRLLVASVDKAMEIGINWWQSDPYLNVDVKQLTEQNRALEAQVAELRKTNFEAIQSRLDAIEGSIAKNSTKLPKKSGNQ